jgi:hypothetical protein
MLAIIGGIPVFSTSAEAIQWGKKFGLTSYHTHMVSQGFSQVTGYMGGSNHNEAIAVTNSTTGTNLYT